MPRNEVGELEMVLGNRQLLSVFFIVVAMLGVFFAVGYIVGKSASPVLAHSAAPLIVESVASPPTAIANSADPAKPSKTEATPHTAPERPLRAVDFPHSREEGVSRPTAFGSEPVIAASATAQPEKREPVKGEEPQKKEETRAASGTQAAGGRAYLQLAATDKPDADKMVDVLRQKGFSTVAMEIRERPGTWRVLVGPISDGGDTLRADLQKMGFAGNEALRRIF